MAGPVGVLGYGLGVADSVITLRLLRKGPRGQALLTRVREQLRDGAVGEPDNGIIEVRLPGRGPRSWDEVREALDAAGSDWREWLHLSPRPVR
ncbi:MAG: hypothetical protein AVDCRST_MAG85-1326 [uncultured Solirubrobacteraceae bacterium]|uniref:Uncharacterized protein n=1 Tax=uncultured Solirubrobacteraceae bacterium TaxID=1162706 RepID=A0A6J4S9E7_9ACTN|nr:MAG: hypothetical protein AVDCRST_MAG85-1326 [uncultured Solirubrobacteraceae bacterium]